MVNVPEQKGTFGNLKIIVNKYMNELSITEKTLIDGYNNDFYFKTGKKLNIFILDKWKSICKLDVKIPANDLVVLICDGLGCDAESVFVSKKTDDLVLKRAIIYFILRSNNISFKKIGQLADDRNYNNIIKAVDSFEVRLDQNKSVSSLLKEVMEYLNETVNSVTIN